jgi:hypothetical protein
VTDRFQAKFAQRIMIFSAIYQSLKNYFRLAEQIDRYFARLLLRCTRSVRPEWQRTAAILTQLVDITCIPDFATITARGAVAEAC